MGWVEIFVSCIFMVPEVALIAPESNLSNVLFPAPSCPNNPRHSREVTLNVKLSMAIVCPVFLLDLLFRSLGFSTWLFAGAC